MLGVETRKQFRLGVQQSGLSKALDTTELADRRSARNQ